MNLAHWLLRSAQTWPDNPALVSGTRVVASYREFADHAAGLAAGLQKQLNVNPGDRVAIFAKNSTSYLEVLYAIWFAGAIAVPINAKLHPREASWIMENSSSSMVFTDAVLAKKIRAGLPGCIENVIEIDGMEYSDLLETAPLEEPVQRGRDDVAWLFYTSGTTGRPKGVMITNGNIHTMAFAYFADVDPVFMQDAALYAAPISHGAGLYNFQHVIMAARHVVPESAGFDPAEILALAPKLQDVHIFAAPTMVRRLVDQARASNLDGEGIRTIVYGGGPMYLADIIDAVAVMGPRFCQIYGQGESPMAITSMSRNLVAERSHPRWRERLASTGTRQSCVEVKVADRNGRALAAGETGEVLVRGETVMRGYWNNEEATNKALRDGWLWTGDLGVFDRDGFLTLKDRSNDMIISGGSNVYPREVEEVLLSHRDVHEVSIVGRPSKDWGEEVVAFVVAKEGCTIDPKLLDAHCLENIARFKRPKDYFVLEELPKSNYGKILKRELRKRFD